MDDKARCRYCGALLIMVGEHTHEKNCRFNDGRFDKLVPKAVEKSSTKSAMPKAAKKAGVKPAGEVKPVKVARPKKGPAPVAEAIALPDPKKEPVCQPAPNASTARSRRWREANREKDRAYSRDYMRKRRGSKSGKGQ